MYIKNRLESIVGGITKMYNANGSWYVLKFILLDLLGNKLGFQINGHVKELIFWEKQAIGVGNFSNNFLEKVTRDLQYKRFPVKIKPYIEEQHARINKVPSVLDVGCGPVSLLADAHHKGEIFLTSVDILADSYKKLLSDYGYTEAMQGINFIESSAEYLTQALNEKSFDIVYCNNALDHTDSPAESLLQMSNLVTCGGYLIISGNCREGTHEKWDGIHMHDIFIENGILYREGKKKCRSRLDDNLPLAVHYSDIDSSEVIEKMFIVFERLHSA